MLASCNVTAAAASTFPVSGFVFFLFVRVKLDVTDMLNNFKVRRVTYVKIHCDSRAALMAINSRDITSRVVYDAIQALNELGEAVKVVLIWVKADADTAGNELADTLAKRDAEGIGEHEIVRVPFVAVTNKIQEQAIEKWQEPWTRYPKARQTKQFFSSIDLPKSKLICGLTRREITRLVASITGHGPFGYHSSLVCPDIDPLCRYCEAEENETFIHLLTKYSVF